MTKLVKNLLISLMAIVMTACLGYASLGAQPITANAATAEYGLWVGGVKVTSDNLVIDNNDDSTIKGSATYDAENNILTLDNFSYTGAGYIFDDGFNNSAIIFAKNELTVKLVGTNVITTTEDRCFDIVSYDLLTITSDTEDKTDGVLTTTCEFCAIDVGSLSISNVTINATGLGAICVNDGDTTINNAIINAIATSEQALLVNDILYVENSSLALESQVGTALDCYDSANSFYTIKNSTLTINSQNEGIRGAGIFVSNSTIEISAVNEAICDSILGVGYAPSFNGSHAVYAGENKENAQLVAVPDDTTFANKYIKIVPAYDVWVAGVQFDASNLTIDREDVASILGLATYDAENNILTLDNFVYTGNVNALIYSTGIDLKIVLKGTNKLVGSVDVNAGIYIEEGSLIIAGSDEYSDKASLELTVDDECIYADYSLSIENVKLTTTTTALPTGNGSPTQAILAYGDLSITNSEVTVIAGDSDGDGIIEFGYTVGIMSVGKVSITGSIVNVSANAGGIGAYISMTIDNSTVIIDGGIYGIAADATSIKNSTVIISGEIAIGTNSMNDGYLIISNSNVEISAQKYVIRNMNYDLPVTDYSLDSTGHVIYGGEDKESATMLTEQADIFSNKYLRFVPAYDVWVAGVQFDALNLTIDSEDNNAIRGSATYDPTSNTLTLDNFEYDSIGDYRGNNDYEPIRVKDGTTIKVVGSNDIACNALSDDNYYAIYGLGSLTIIGNGDTDVLSTRGYKGGGIYSSDTLTIQNLKLAVHANQSAIHSKKEITLDKVSGEIYSWYEDGIYVSDFFNSVNILNCNLLIEGYRKGITVNYSVVYFENSFVEICSQDGYALWDADSSAIAYVNYQDKHFVFAGWYEEEAEEVHPYDANSFKNNYVKIVPTRKITLNFSSVGLPSEEVFVIVNEPAIIETPVIDGYIFIGWYNEDTLETAFDFSTPITENITIYAKFANYTQDIANINSQINGVKGSITSLQSSIDGKADATELANSVIDLQGKINDLTTNYQLADDAQQLEIDALESQVSELINETIALLNIKVTNIEAKLNGIDLSQIALNKTAIAENVNEITALKGLVNSLDDTYINNTELANLKDALELADKGLNDLITALTTRVDKTESDIASLVSNKADVTLVNEKVEELKGLINALDAVKNNYKTADEELKNQLTTVIDNAKQQAIDSATELVNNAKTELAIAINAKADTTTVNAKVEELNKTIENAKTVASAYTDGKVEELNSAIATAKQQAIDSATELVNNVKTELNAAIALKADNATVIAKFAEVDSAIAILQGLSDDYLSADTELKEELTILIANTKAEIIELIIAGDKANANALEEEIAKLRAEIEAVKNATNEDIKEAESNAQVLPTVIASAAVLGDIALLVWLIIKRKIVR